MFLPRPGARGRLLNWSAKTNLRSRIRWVSDGLSNNVTEIEFDEGGNDLTFTFQFEGMHFGGLSIEQFALEKRAEKVPVQYTPMNGPTFSAFCARIPRMPISALPLGPGAL